MRSLRGVVPAFLGAAAAFLAIALSVKQGGAIVAMDRTVAAWLSRWHDPGLLQFLACISTLHSPRAMLALTGAVALVLLLRRETQALVVLSVTVVGGSSLNHAFKHSFMRPRPGMDAIQAQASDFSFPSGHVVSATLLYGVIVLFIVGRTARRSVQWLAVAGAAALVVLVCLSRIALGAHYFSDVLAGALFGLMCLMLCAGMLNRRA